MLYALNLFNIRNGKQAQYQQYLREAAVPLAKVGGAVIAGGRNPVASIGDDKKRQYFLVVQYPDREALKEFGRLTEESGIHEVRNQAVTDYIWTLFDPWDVNTEENA
jgi:uncharacterized protein (DUF1330 family)